MPGAQGWASAEELAEYLRVVSLYELGLDRARVLRRQYTMQRYGASERCILFEFTFEDWLKIWIDSGHLHERGHCKGQYVMARFGDKGPYAIGNVRICTAEENGRENAASGLMYSVEASAKISAAMLGNTRALGCVRSVETLARMSEAALRNPKKNEPRRKGRKNSKKSCANMKKGQERRRARERRLKKENDL